MPRVRLSVTSNHYLLTYKKVSLTDSYWVTVIQIKPIINRVRPPWLNNWWGVIPGQDGPPTCRSLGDRLLECETKEGPFGANIHHPVALWINKNNRG